MVPNQSYPRAPISDDERRSSPRIPVSLSATSRPSGDVRRFQADVSDLSVEGCKLFVTGLHKGEQVWVGIAHLAPMPATVCWVDGPAVGLRFKSRLHDSVVTHLTGR
jgi:hypothetical protein